MKPPETINRNRLEQEILPRVFKPARYLGMERGAFCKDPASVAVRMAMIFPDLYEIGVSNYGHKLLYSLVNHHPDYLCDRAYAPDKDMKAALAEADMPLYGLESFIPLKSFEMLAFTLQYELNYTSILGVLDSAQIPFRTENRPDWSTPILISGGPGSGNPMPLSPFFDAVIIGDGEEVLIEILDVLKQAKAEDWSKPDTRVQLAKLEGVFVPGISGRVHKRIYDITKGEIDLAPLIPYIETVHDRVTIETRRGCDRMCRFCQPCFINLPVREMPIEKVRDQALKEIEKTGYEECSLLALSIADYSQLKPLINEVTQTLQDKGVSVSLPSQRADRFDIDVANAVQKVRKSTLTFAPEAGTERLRDVINKNLSDAEIMQAVTSAYRAGWNKVKLYFMIGLPTETDNDLLGIAHLVHKLQQACLLISREDQLSRKKKLEINITLSNFVPKPHTPFQWVRQATMAELRHKRDFLRQAFRQFHGIKLSFTDPEISKLEAVISKGDARMGEVIERAYLKGDYLGAWSENLLFKEWFEALQELNIDPDDFTANSYVKPGEPLPWDCIEVGLDKKWLIEEYEKSIEQAKSEPCFIGCNTCGVCQEFGVQPVFIRPSDLDNFTPTETRNLTKSELFPAPTALVRMTVQKRGNLKYISHLDWMRMLRRAVFRARVPIAYTQGYNPKQKMSFGPALPLFVEGLEEYVDFEMVEKVPDLKDRLNAYLPDEGKILHCEWIPLHSSSLDKRLRYVIYSGHRTPLATASGYNLRDRIDDLFSKPEWLVDINHKKTQKSIDLKPYIQDLDISPPDGVVFKLIVNRQDLQIKPSWVLNLIDPDAAWEVSRVKIGLDHANANLYNAVIPKAQDIGLDLYPAVTDQPHMIGDRQCLVSPLNKV